MKFINVQMENVGVEHLRHNLQIITEISIRKCSTLCAVTNKLSLRFRNCWWFAKV